MENLKQTLAFGGLLNQEEIDKVVASFTPRLLKAGAHLMRQGEQCDELAFIAEGILRIYINREEMEEATKYFFRRNQFMMDIGSFYNNSPVDASAQAVVDTALMVTNRANWFQLSEEIPKLFILTKSLTEVALMNKIKDNDYLYFGTAKQKYQEFMRRYPDLALTVPLQYIASYLQITPQSLSRLRKEK